MSGLEGVLAAHRFSKGIAECACGVELGGRGHRTEAHRAHVAAEVRAWLASELADVTAVLDEWDREPSLPPSTYNLVDDVRTALTAVRAHLTGELAAEVGDEKCGSCLACARRSSVTGFQRSRMYVCATCGNKRCPAAGDCRKWECSGSNDPEQIPVLRDDWQETK